MPEGNRAEVLAYIALGANLGEAQVQVCQAIDDISKLPYTRLIRTSSLYRTAPFEASGPDYINAVIAILSRLDVYDLLYKLQQIEVTHGRNRPFKNAPRTLDLDILLFGEACIDSACLKVPHPRILERAFVLVPLSEIAPEKVTVAQLAAVANQRVIRFGH
jgi:2-amino-4-hydroxy-6-hydroxymethyldihydropteridine diphosphokinase